MGKIIETFLDLKNMSFKIEIDTLFQKAHVRAHDHKISEHQLQKQNLQATGKRCGHIQRSRNGNGFRNDDFSVASLEDR